MAKTKKKGEKGKKIAIDNLAEPQDEVQPEVNEEPFDQDEAPPNEGYAEEPGNNGQDQDNTLENQKGGNAAGDQDGDDPGNNPDDNLATKNQMIVEVKANWKIIEITDVIVDGTWLPGPNTDLTTWHGNTLRALVELSKLTADSRPWVTNKMFGFWKERKKGREKGYNLGREWPERQEKLHEDLNVLITKAQNGRDLIKRKGKGKRKAGVAPTEAGQASQAEPSSEAGPSEYAAQSQPTQSGYQPQPLQQPQPFHPFQGPLPIASPENLRHAQKCLHDTHLQQREADAKVLTARAERGRLAMTGASAGEVATAKVAIAKAEQARAGWASAVALWTREVNRIEELLEAAAGGASGAGGEK